MKVGDYSSSGRTYTREVQEGSGASCATVCFYIFLFAFVVSVGVLAFLTYKTPHWVAHLDTVADDVEAGRSMLFRNVPAQAKTFGDDEFRIEFPMGTLQASRNVEYCQWEETRHVTREKQRDQDGASTTRVLEHTSFTYHKTWRAHRISSAFFDAAVAHHNPQDDPFPGSSLYARAVLDSRVHVHGKGLPTANREPLYLTRQHFDSMQYGSNAWAQGFRSMDTQYVYRYYDKSTAGSLLQGVAQFLVDGVIGTGIRGTCEPGDIRVSYDVAYIASPLSAIVQGDHVVFAEAGDASLQQILENQYGSLMNSLWWSRAAALGLFLLAFFFYRGHRNATAEGAQKAKSH